MDGEGLEGAIDVKITYKYPKILSVKHLILRFNSKLTQIIRFGKKHMWF